MSNITQWTLDVPLVAPTLNRWQRMSWKEQHPIKLEWYETIRVLCLEQRIPTLDLINLDIAVYYQCIRKRDWDNGAPAFKLTQDGLTHAGVLPDDDPRHILRPRFPDIRIDHRRSRTIVTIAEAQRGPRKDSG